MVGYLIRWSWVLRPPRVNSFFAHLRFLLLKRSARLLHLCALPRKLDANFEQVIAMLFRLPTNKKVKKARLFLAFLSPLLNRLAAEQYLFLPLGSVGRSVTYRRTAGRVRSVGRWQISAQCGTRVATW